MEDIPEVYNIETVEQLRAIADPLRLRIVAALSQRPLTATGLGEALGLPANKAHYHVRELEKVGLVRLVETRERGGILEKYYRAVAKTIDVPGSLLQTIPPDESIAVANEYLQSYTRGFLRAFARGLRLPGWDDHRMTLATTSLWLTDDEYRDKMGQIYALLEPYRDPRGIAGEREHAVAFLAYDASLAGGEDTAGLSRAETAGTAVSASPGRPPANDGLLIGVLHYTRRELEGVVARGERLDINVVGAVAFADDIPADLVDRAVARFRHRGALKASPAVRDALKRKEVRTPE